MKSRKKCISMSGLISGRRRAIKGLTNFPEKYPGSIPVIIDSKNIETLLMESDVAGLFRSGRIF
jgi:hypothetical protein